VEYITLTFTRFKTVFDDDFVFIRDGEGSSVFPGDTQASSP
jgi:hypothetical protein